MSGIILIAPLCAIFASLGVLAAVQVVCRLYSTNRSAKAAGCSAALLTFPIACAFFFWWFPRLTTHSEVGASGQRANEHLRTFKIPGTASNVDYRSSYFAALTDAADFDIFETEFKQWMSDDGRTPTAFILDAARI